jgi:peptidoglycan/LPS O-acetylase OafA/YrhL
VRAGIDSLRGLAIVLVVLPHIGLRIPFRKGLPATFVPLRVRRRNGDLTSEESVHPPADPP